MHPRRPRGRRIAALLLWAWLGPVATASALDIDPTHLATDDVVATQALVDDVLPRLPQAWRDGLPAGALTGLTLGIAARSSLVRSVTAKRSMPTFAPRL